MRKPETIQRKKLVLSTMEEVIRDGNTRDPILNLIHIYFGIAAAFPVLICNGYEQEDYFKRMNLNSLSNWPPDLRRLWLKLNQIFLNPETPLEKKQNRIYNMIKNKYLSMSGLNYPRRA